MSELTRYDIIKGYTNPEWSGHGYLGTCLFYPDKVTKSDTFLLAEANRREWDDKLLFLFLNSTDGRHYADASLDNCYDKFLADLLSSLLDHFESWGRGYNVAV
jgi:hypothetical protein